MAQVTKNALKGYSYQDYVYIMFMTIMDTGDEILAIDAEVGKDKKHDFDDIKLYTKDKEYVVQVKDYNVFDQSKFRVDSESIEVNGIVNKLSKEDGNIFILHNCPLDTNGQLWGLDVIEKENLYIIPLPTEKIEKYIDNRYGMNDKRILQIIRFGKERLANEAFYCKKEELPKMKVFQQVMDIKTELIRDKISKVEKGILYIVGKPGIGKSHYVHELAAKMDNILIYHFWVGAQDEFINERLQYQNFIQNIGYSVYHDCRWFSEEELIKEIIKQEKILIIDGLDHVENYNERQLEKYFSFFAKLDEVKTIILTRPLRHEIGTNIYYLENWSYNETIHYLEKCHHIFDRKIQEEIYKVADGYPILSYFIACHYRLYRTIESTVKINDLNEYYRNLLMKAGIENEMLIFNVTNTFLTTKDIEVISKNKMLSEIIVKSIERYPYLFERKYNRIMLFHDSFNTFLRSINEKDSINDYVKNVENSLLHGDIRFMPRMMSLTISNDVKDVLLEEYSNFDKFIELLENNWDIESVVEFYDQLLQYLAISDSEKLSVYQYYAFVLIYECCKRVYVGYDMGMLYQKIRYIYHTERDSLGEIFSNHMLFRICNWLFKFDNNRFEIKEKITTEFEDKFKYEAERFFLEAMEEDQNYFNKYRDKFNYHEFLSELIETEKDEIVRYRACGQIIVSLFLQNEEFYGLKEEFETFLYDDLISTDGSIKKLLDLCEITFASVDGLLNYCKHILYTLGELEEGNPYRVKSIKKLVLGKLEKCSNKTWDVQNYIRLAIKENRVISVAESNYCYIMMQEEKDYSVLWLPEALLLYEKKQCLSVKSSLRILTNIMKMSSRGHTGLIDNYFNLYNVSELQYMIQDGLLQKEYPINVFNWGASLIDCVPEEYIKKQLNDMIYDSHFCKIIEEKDIINLLKSKYGSRAKQFFEDNGFRIMNLGINLSSDNSKKTYKERGYIELEDKKQIIEDGISCLELASYKSGNYDSFPEVELFEIYPKEELKKNFLKITHTSLISKCRTIDSYGNMYCYVARIPQLADMSGYSIDWSIMFDIFKRFLYITGLPLE